MKDLKKIRFDVIKVWLFLPLSVLWMELFVKLMIYHSLTDLHYTILFSLAAGILCTFFCTLFSEKVNRRILIVFSALISFFYSFEYVYFAIFKTFFSCSTFSMAGDVLQFWDHAVIYTFKNFHAVIWFFLPTLFLIFFGKRWLPVRRAPWSLRGILAVILILCQCTPLLLIANTSGPDSDKHFYNGVQTPAESVKRFGLLTAARLDFKEWLFGKPDMRVDISDINSDYLKVESASADLQQEDYNVLDIDFQTLIDTEENAQIKRLHQYFSQKEPTAKNEYTGMFKGKNLIFMTLEGFSNQIISKELTPTLYKMATQGFVFENFYTSMWGGSTATGEYAATTGNFYQTANCISKSAETLMPFTIANALGKEGYATYAYHDHTATYYDRDKAYPNMGFDSYEAIGNGLEESMTDCWPRSDNEMAKVTFDSFTKTTPFLAYFMSISGHGYYSWNSSEMSAKNRDRVEHLDYSEDVKAYIAAQLEVEDMLTTLVDKLDEAGILEDTVFVMSADHLPYFLKDDEMAELYDLPEDGLYGNLDLYRNGLIIWSASMENPVRVSTPCSAIDILPTLLNLFGLSYDSRLLTGTDILSGTEPVAIINCLGSGGSWNWHTSQGRYNTSTKTFEKSSSCTLTDEEIPDYINAINTIVAAKQNSSPQILDQDYYRHVFRDDGSLIAQIRS